MLPQPRFHIRTLMIVVVIVALVMPTMPYALAAPRHRLFGDATTIGVLLLIVGIVHALRIPECRPR